jgi:glycosyltransferase involved in cell wall biosynthesis
LPLIESLACGATVIASDIPVLREVGGEAAIYRPVANVSDWVDAIMRTLSDPGFAPPRDLRLSQAARYTWKEHARVIGEAYLSLKEAKHPSPLKFAPNPNSDHPTV